MAVRETAASHSKCLGSRLVVVALLGGWNLLLVCGLLVRHLARVNQCYVDIARVLLRNWDILQMARAHHQQAC